MSQATKSIVVYYKDSYYRYDGIFIDCMYQVQESGDLVVYHRDRVTGDETVAAWFRKWDYFLIEEE
jgi:hypothetical protein|tara:strand:+ start:1242 stop:1439 length:198 start_codon:yes stop_codon:yes gene_type:complete